MQDDEAGFRGDPFPRYLNADPLSLALERKEVAWIYEGQPSVRGSRLLGGDGEPMPKLALLYSVPDEEKQPAAGDEPVEEPTLQWIEFRVLDDDTDEPYGGVQLELKLTTGEVRQFTTDGAGRIRIDGIPAGSCDVQKMLDDLALEVVKVA